MDKENITTKQVAQFKIALFWSYLTSALYKQQFLFSRKKCPREVS